MQRAIGEEPTYARSALTLSRRLGFAYGEVHAAVTLGLAGCMPLSEAEAIIAASNFLPPSRTGGRDLLRFSLGPRPELHPLSFP